jgi:protein-S-isoprenylcysteine O-methyltransferase Ste14
VADGVAFTLTVAAWVVLELGQRVRERLHGRGGTARDRATRILIGASIGAAVALAALTAAHLQSLRVSASGRAVGVVVMWLGLAIRGWAIATLGGAFRTTVEVDAGQAVVSTGPYAWVRHPSYTGLLLIVTGFGLAAGNWLGAAICLVAPLPAVVRRIAVEEAELTRVLGDPYRRYAARTKRLVPGVW